MTIAQAQEDIIDAFSMFDPENWDERYQYLIDLGKGLIGLDEQYKTDDNLIKGCQSKVWLHAREENGLLYFDADSDAIITKGIVALLVSVFSGQKPADILEATPYFIDEIGLKDHLSPTRANGLVSMIKQIKLYALAYQTKM